MWFLQRAGAKRCSLSPDRLSCPLSRVQEFRPRLVAAGIDEDPLGDDMMVPDDAALEVLLRDLVRGGRMRRRCRPRGMRARVMRSGFVACGRAGVAARGSLALEPEMWRSCAVKVVLTGALRAPYSPAGRVHQRRVSVLARPWAGRSAAWRALRCVLCRLPAEVELGGKAGAAPPAPGAG